MKSFVEPIRDAGTPEEQRAELNRLREHDSLVRNVMQRADYIGMSGEDRYTILAYLLMKDRQQLRNTIFMSKLCCMTPRGGNVR
jgi:hypothetical protein